MTKKEDNALVLDFLPSGVAGEARKQPIVQLVGESYFTLLDAQASAGFSFSALDRVFIGKGERQGIEQIRGRIAYAQLTSTAQRELPSAVESIVKAREAEFVGFLNRAGPINIRAHSLELLPGIGKKHLEEILRQRESKPFGSFEDVTARVSHLGDASEIFSRRILDELSGEQKYYIFTRGPPEEREGDYRFDRSDGRYTGRNRY
jgi:putative nucleotide binding protein